MGVALTQIKKLFNCLTGFVLISKLFKKGQTIHNECFVSKHILGSKDVLLENKWPYLKEKSA